MPPGKSRFSHPKARKVTRDLNWQKCAYILKSHSGGRLNMHILGGGGKCTLENAFGLFSICESLLFVLMGQCVVKERHT